MITVWHNQVLLTGAEPMEYTFTFIIKLMRTTTINKGLTVLCFLSLLIKCLLSVLWQMIYTVISLAHDKILHLYSATCSWNLRLNSARVFLLQRPSVCVTVGVTRTIECQHWCNYGSDTGGREGSSHMRLHQWILKMNCCKWKKA